MKRLTVLLLFLAAALSAANTHTLTVSFTYDFTVDNACSATVTTGCLKQFNVYDLTSGTLLLFASQAPSGANTVVNGITATSPPITLKAGDHTFGVTAQMADGTESVPATATARVKPNAPTNLAGTVQ